MNSDLSPELVAITRVIGEHRDLQMWFRNLTALPRTLRASVIGRLVSAMRAAGEDVETVKAFEMLTDPEICITIDRVIRERYPFK